jgi:predicted nucleic acid-binding Zn ribbon protein
MKRSAGSQRPVGEALNSVYRTLDSGALLRESLALAYWPEVVGPQAAAATEAEYVKDGILFVRTKSSVWSHELTFLKSHILVELNRRMGRPLIKEIIYRAQGVKKPDEPADSSDHPTDEDLKLVILHKEEQADIDREIESLASIKDEKIRESVRCRIVHDRRLRRWRLDHGWKECPGCRAVHNTDDPLCPICRLCR